MKNMISDYRARPHFFPDGLRSWNEHIKSSRTSRVSQLRSHLNKIFNCPRRVGKTDSDNRPTWIPTRIWKPISPGVEYDASRWTASCVPSSWLRHCRTLTYLRSLEGSFSAGSTATTATKYSFFQVFRDLQN